MEGACREAERVAEAWAEGSVAEAAAEGVMAANAAITTQQATCQLVFDYIDKGTGAAYLHMNFDVRVLSERAVGAGWVTRRVRVAVGRGIRQAHVVGGRRIFAAGQVARVVVV